MTFFRFLFFISLALLLTPTFSQEKFTISGYVKDAATGEFLIGSNVFIKETLKGTTTNQYGFYSLTLAKGEYNLVVSFVGYNEYKEKINLNKNLRINASISETAVTTEEVVITGEKADKNVQGAQMGNVEISMDKIKTLPAFLGEADVLKAIQLLPGVQSAGEGNTGFYVRGGGPDQNLILLDEAIVYNASHLFGFFSVFNPDAIKNVNLIKGGMPANYGGRVSSVLDISTNEGNNREYHVAGGIGLISSRIMVEGPLKKDTGSFILSARRTYASEIITPFVNKKSMFYGSSYYFYDLNGKVNYRLSDKDRIFLSAYYGRDVFKFEDKNFGFKASVPWGNATASLRWNHLFNDKLFLNTSAIYSNYDFSFGATQSSFEFKMYSGIRDWNGKIDLTWFPTGQHTVKFGGNYIYHTFIPSNVSAKSGDVTFDLGKVVKMYSHDAALYINDEFDVTENLKINGGLRFTYFQHIGPFDRYVKNKYSNKISDTIHYYAGENIAWYRHLEPRLSVRYTLSKSTSIKAAYTRNYQYVHMASISSVALPNDTWIPSSSIVEPQEGNQYAIGIFKNFKNNMFETSVELYYKDMKHQIEFKEGTSPESNVGDNLDNNLTFGRGWSYGGEFFIKKAYGKFNGWIGYTLSWTKRQFSDINGGEVYFAKYDRRHDISVTASYQLTKRWTLSAVWVFASGNAITLPVSRYFINGYIVDEYSSRNSSRMPDYHRGDISVTYEFKKKKRLEHSLNFSVFNVYNRYNPYFIYFKTTGSFENYNLKIEAKQVSLFPILPSLTWNFKF